MKKLFFTFVIGGILGFAAGAGLMLVAFPFVFPPPEVNETVDSMTAAGEWGAASFREGASGQDAGHWGRGDLKIYHAKEGGYLLELQGNFEVGPGPNFWIYLNSEADIDDEADFFADSARVKVTKLKSFTGSQVYHLEADALEAAKSITIWCESFNQYIASANISG